jgi:hypothetical protein
MFHGENPHLQPRFQLLHSAWVNGDAKVDLVEFLSLPFPSLSLTTNSSCVPIMDGAPAPRARHTFLGHVAPLMRHISSLMVVVNALPCFYFRLKQSFTTTCSITCNNLLQG